MWLDRKAKKFRDGEPCDHPGCFSHISHPCEGCGRTGGRYRMWLDEIEAMYEIDRFPSRGTTGHIGRMARVLRELGEIAKEAEWHGLESGGDGQCPICTGLKELGGHGPWCPYTNLSDDAKELLDVA